MPSRPTPRLTVVDNQIPVGEHLLGGGGPVPSSGPVRDAEVVGGGSVTATTTKHGRDENRPLSVISTAGRNGQPPTKPSTTCGTLGRAVMALEADHLRLLEESKELQDAVARLAKEKEDAARMAKAEKERLLEEVKELRGAIEVARHAEAERDRRTKEQQSKIEGLAKAKDKSDRAAEARIASLQEEVKKLVDASKEPVALGPGAAIVHLQDENTEQQEAIQRRKKEKKLRNKKKCLTKAKEKAALATKAQLAHAQERELALQRPDELYYFKYYGLPMRPEHERRWVLFHGIRPGWEAHVEGCRIPQEELRFVWHVPRRDERCETVRRARLKLRKDQRKLDHGDLALAYAAQLSHALERDLAMQRPNALLYYKYYGPPMDPEQERRWIFFHGNFPVWGATFRLPVEEVPPQAEHRFVWHVPTHRNPHLLRSQIQRVNDSRFFA